MVRLTAEYVERKCSQMQLNKSLSKKIKKDELYGLTHLRMNDMFISSIGSFTAFKNLKVIYLQNNNISKIENLNFAVNLTHLYLQHNLINKIENLDTLGKLQTLYLGYNNIVVVEGLERLKNLTVLQIENQRLSSGESLCFDPRSIRALSTCLKALNISGNKIVSLKNIKELHELEILEAKNNVINDIDDLTECISGLASLTSLSLQGNPITQYHRYKENLIANNDTISMFVVCFLTTFTLYYNRYQCTATLDGKLVTDVCRLFMKRFKAKKHLHHTRKPSTTRLDEDITSSLNLPPALKASISRAMFQHPKPKSFVTISSALGETQSYIFPPWKTASGANAKRNGHIAPRPFWNKMIKVKQPRTIKPLISNQIIELPLI